MAALHQAWCVLGTSNPVTKSQRTTDVNGAILSTTVELDPWGGDTNRSGEWEPKQFTSYIRDSNASDDAQMRRYNRYHVRFDQPDLYAGSYELDNPQTFNKYTYTANDPVNFTDPRGLKPKCTFPPFNKLTQAQQDLFGKNGSSIWDGGGLTDLQKASFLDTTGALAKALISTTLLTLVDDNGNLLNGAINEHTELDFGGNPNPFIQDVVTAEANHQFTNDPFNFGQHNGRSARQLVTTNSLHVGNGPLGSQAHIDPFGSLTDVVGLVGHEAQFFGHKVEKLADKLARREYPGGTDPLKVGRGLGSNVTGYNANCTPDRSRKPGGMGGGGVPTGGRSAHDNWAPGVSENLDTWNFVDEVSDIELPPLN